MTFSTLWGEKYDTHDIAKFLIKEELLNTPYIGFKRNFESNSIISVHYYKHGQQISLSNECGIYVIYRRILNSLECLYVGYTEESFHGRGYRWMKELEGKCREDENHPGAIIARDKYGIKSSDNFYMKIIPFKAIINIYKKYGCAPTVDAKQIDEHIAYELKAKCNTNCRNYSVAHMCQLGVGIDLDQVL